MSDLEKKHEASLTRRTFLQVAGAMGAMSVLAPQVLWADGKKILKIREYASLDSFDPIIHAGIPEETVHHAIYNKLVSYIPGDKWGWRKEIAESIEQVDDTHIAFTIKQGVMFTNGYGEMTAEDVKYSLERHFDPKLKSQLKGDLGPMSHVEVTGRYSGVIVLKEAFQPIWMTGIAYMAGNIISKKATEEKGGTFTSAPCSSGPYKVKDWKPKQSVILERSDIWIGDPAEFDEIHILTIDDEKTAEIGYESGDIDFTRIAMSSIENYKNSLPKNTVFDVKPSLYYVWLGMNMENGILKDKRIRQAVQYGIDVDLVLEAAYFGAADRATGILAPGLLGHREKNIIEKPDYAKAKALLAEAGYPDGIDLTIDVLNKTTNTTAAQVMQMTLAQVGIRLTINVHESGSFWVLGDMSKGDDWKNVQLVMNRFSTAPEAYYASQWFVKEQIGVWNWEHFTDPEYETLFVEAAVEKDEQKRDKMYQRMQDIMEESGAYLFLTHEAVPMIYNKDIKPALRPDGVPLLRYFQSK